MSQAYFPLEPEPASRSDAHELSPLKVAIRRGRDALVRLQRADGAWEGITDLGPVAPAMHWIVEARLGHIGREDRAAGSRYLLAQQQPDGSFVAYPGASQGSAAATALSRAGLLACGVEASHRAPQAAEAFIAGHGGYLPIARALFARGDATLLFLVAAGVASPDLLPPIPPELALTPFDKVAERRVHAGNFMVLLVLCAMVARYARGVPRGVFATTARRLENARIQRYLFSWQNDGGDWNGQACQTWLMLLGLEATGLDRSDPRIARALTWLRNLRREEPQGLTFNAMNTDVWSTAFGALALHAAGMDPGAPPLLAARAHLLAAQVQQPMPRVNQRKPGAARSGGWPFQRGNDTMPDSDDTGIALAALATTAGGLGRHSEWRAIELGQRWLRDMQNPDGGFPAFVWNLPSKVPGPMYQRDLYQGVGLAPLGKMLLEPPPELSDPAAEGITGRALWGLGACGVTRDDPAVCRAIAFLRHQQCEHGGFWGRWMTCYLAETATVLVGLAAVGEDMRADYTARALSFLRAHQNDDGGFGEDVAAYVDPGAAGRGPSSPPVTAYVLLGLLAASRNVDAPILRAAAYLRQTQLEDGSWDNAGWLHTMIPPDSFFTADIPAKAVPLLALATLERRLAEASPCGG